MVIDTACSASMVALYQACRALQNEDCRTAIAGGVNVIAGPDVSLSTFNQTKYAYPCRCI